MRSSIKISPFGLAGRWWSITVRGASALALGVVALVFPHMTLRLLAFLFGVYCLVDGSFNLAAALRSLEAERHWTALLCEALASIAAGVATLVWPGISSMTLTVVIGVWGAVTGALAIVTALRLRRHLRRDWLMAAGGAASGVLGALCLGRPGADTTEVLRWLGPFGLLFGALLVAVGLRLRRAKNRQRTQPRLRGGGRLLPLPAG
ncbi:MAG TPA: DUF308 domain-containing protein [Polyangia bacterium]